MCGWSGEVWTGVGVGGGAVLGGSTRGQSGRPAGTGGLGGLVGIRKYHTHSPDVIPAARPAGRTISWAGQSPLDSVSTWGVPLKVNINALEVHPVILATWREPVPGRANG